MKIFLTLTVSLLTLSTFSTAPGDNYRTKARIAERERIRHIYTTRPHRLDEPLRAENISDDETREIQVLIAEHYPGAIANIGGVTAGCPCENGLKCNSQVWILAHRDNRYDGLMLSRINNQWTIGPIQQWWFKYDELMRRKREDLAERNPESRFDYFEYRDKIQHLQDAFPRCLLTEQEESPNYP